MSTPFGDRPGPDLSGNVGRKIKTRSLPFRAHLTGEIGHRILGNFFVRSKFPSNIDNFENPTPIELGLDPFSSEIFFFDSLKSKKIMRSVQALSELTSHNGRLLKGTLNFLSIARQNFQGPYGQFQPSNGPRRTRTGSSRFPQIPGGIGPGLRSIGVDLFLKLWIDPDFFDHSKKISRTFDQFISSNDPGRARNGPILFFWLAQRECARAQLDRSWLPDDRFLQTTLSSLCSPVYGEH